MLKWLAAKATSSRTYHLLGAIFALFLSLTFAIRDNRTGLGSLTQFWLLALLGVDATLRWSSFGLHSTLALTDVIITSLSVNVYVFNLSFSWIANVNVVPILSVAFAVRCIVSAQQYVSLRELVRALPRRFYIEDTTSGRKTKKCLEICYVTSRIICVSKGSLVSEEHEFLESKYSNFLKSLPSPRCGEICPLSTLATIVESAVVHLFSNPVNVVCINTPVGDSNATLIACGLLLRTGAARSATAAVNMYLKQRYLVHPEAEKFIPSTLFSQLKIFETIMVRSASKELVSAQSSDRQYMIKRIVVSQLDASQNLDLRLAVVEIESGKIFAHNIYPSSSASSLTFLCNCTVAEDTLFVLSDGSGRPVAKFYMNAKFHLEKIVASQSGYHYVVSCYDKWTPRLDSVRVEVTASLTEPDSPGDRKLTNSLIDKELLLLPPGGSTRDSSCLIV